MSHAIGVGAEVPTSLPSQVRLGVSHAGIDEDEYASRRIPISGEKVVQEGVGDVEGIARKTQAMQVGHGKGRVIGLRLTRPSDLMGRIHHLLQSLHIFPAERSSSRYELGASGGRAWARSTHHTTYHVGPTDKNCRPPQ